MKGLLHFIAVVITGPAGTEIRKLQELAASRFDSSAALRSPPQSCILLQRETISWKVSGLR
jgi:hypothetical protein